MHRLNVIDCGFKNHKTSKLQVCQNWHTGSVATVESNDENSAKGIYTGQYVQITSIVERVKSKLKMGGSCPLRRRLILDLTPSRWIIWRKRKFNDGGPWLQRKAGVDVCKDRPAIQMKCLPSLLRVSLYAHKMPTGFTVGTAYDSPKPVNQRVFLLSNYTGYENVSANPSIRLGHDGCAVYELRLKHCCLGRQTLVVFPISTIPRLSVPCLWYHCQCC